MLTEAGLLEQVKSQIETKSGWGDSRQWSNQDFDLLSEEIFTVTGVRLSASTLKRIWGRVRYTSAPNPTTLNALAQYLNYSDWRSFRLAQPDVNQAGLPATVSPTPKGTGALNQPSRRLFGAVSPGTIWSIGLVTGLCVALGLAFSLLPDSSAGERLNPAQFAFTSRRLTLGLPNSVVFAYDATAAPTDSVFVQQSWDPTRRHLVSRATHQHTSIYYYPGFYRAKLVVGRQVVGEHDLLIPSEGWLAAIKQEPVPVYLDGAAMVQGGVLRVPIAVIERNRVPIQPRPPVVTYQYVQPFAGLKTDNFSFETRLRHDYGHGSAACRNVQIRLIAENDALVIPLCAKGCVANLSLYLAGRSISSKQADLSGLGADLSQWVTLRGEVRNRHARLWVDEHLAYETDLPNAATKLVGICYNFEGTGSVDYVRLKRLDGQVVFSDDFNATIDGHRSQVLFKR